MLDGKTFARCFFGERQGKVFADNAAAVSRKIIYNKV